MENIPLTAGLTGQAVMQVGAADLAIALGSGDVPVLGTPRVVALCEAATVDALKAHLPASHTSVGTRVDIRHMAPTAIGGTVVANATLLAVDHKTLIFEVEAKEGDKRIALGSVQRALVNREKFLSSL